MSKYISDLTEFRAYEAPYTDTIYVKDGNTKNKIGNGGNEHE